MTDLELEFLAFCNVTEEVFPAFRAALPVAGGIP